MLSSDIINGLFEFGGAAANALSIKALAKHKTIAGVHWAPTVFFFSWGVWNLFYYPNLSQWFSLIGAIALVSTNLIWIVMLILFSRKENDYRL